MINAYLSLSTRSGFNNSVEHFRVVTDITGRMKKGENLADIVEDLESKLSKSQIGPILNSLVVERLDYTAISLNLPVNFSDFEAICEAVSVWKNIDIVLAYHHPQLGITLINPKKIEHWKNVQDVSVEELMVIYVKSKNNNSEEGEKAAQMLKQIFMGVLSPDEARL